MIRLTRSPRQLHWLSSRKRKGKRLFWSELKGSEVGTIFLSTRRVAGGMGAGALLAKYSRDDEREADVYFRPNY